MSDYQKILSHWRSLAIHTVTTLEKHLENFPVLFAYHSGKIQNDNVTYATTWEIFEKAAVKNYSGDLRTLFTQYNQLLCFAYLNEKIFHKEPLSVQMIKEAHGILTSGTLDQRRFLINSERPGQFKKREYMVGMQEIGAAPADVEQEITSLIDEINSYTGDDHLTVATYFHVRLENIHPFADGNGRLGRILLNYYLMTHDHPPIIIFEEDKKAYYEALRLYDKQETIEPMHEFLLRQTEKTWGKWLPSPQDKPKPIRKTLESHRKK